MRITSYYPVLATSDVAATAAFYQDQFGFEPRYVADWYVHLGHPAGDSIALAILAMNHATIPPVGRVPARGMLINLEVEDVNAEYDQLTGLGVEVLLPLRSEPFGQRHFILQGPDGVPIDVITPIPPEPEYAAGFATA